MYANYSQVVTNFLIIISYIYSMEQPPKQSRRRAKPESEKKKPYTLSLTDAEAGRLDQLAEDAGAVNSSQYLIKKLKLNVTPKPKPPI